MLIIDIKSQNYITNYKIKIVTSHNAMILSIYLYVKIFTFYIIIMTLYLIILTYDITNNDLPEEFFFLCSVNGLLYYLVWK